MSEPQSLLRILEIESLGNHHPYTISIAFHDLDGLREQPGVEPRPQNSQLTSRELNHRERDIVVAQANNDESTRCRDDIATFANDSRHAGRIERLRAEDGWLTLVGLHELQDGPNTVGTAGGNDPDTGDIYQGLDRFARIKDCHWRNYGSSADVDRIKYGYDRSGSRLWRENTVAASSGKSLDELYGYDLIDRPKSMDRGGPNALQDAIRHALNAAARSAAPAWVAEYGLPGLSERIAGRDAAKTAAEQAGEELQSSEQWRSLAVDLPVRVASLVRGVRHGQFPMASTDPRCTSRCPYSTVCRVNQVRSLGKEWQPPSEDPT